MTAARTSPAREAGPASLTVYPKTRPGSAEWQTSARSSTMTGGKSGEDGDGPVASRGDLMTYRLEGVAKTVGGEIHIHPMTFDLVPGGLNVLQIGRAHVELQSLMRISYAVFCLKKKKNTKTTITNTTE